MASKDKEVIELPHERARRISLERIKGMDIEEALSSMKCNKIVNHSIIDIEEAYNYISKYKLHVSYVKELKDGTPRRIWQLRDPEGQPCGLLYTAISIKGFKNQDDYKQDVFDFMEVRINYAEYNDKNKPSSPRTSYFIRKEIEEKETK